MKHEAKHHNHSDVRGGANRVLRDQCLEAGASVDLVWEMPGPHVNHVQWVSCYVIGDSTCIVETLADDDWRAFLQSGKEPTVAEVIARCYGKRPPEGVAP